jgi:DNA polymerase-1
MRWVAVASSPPGRADPALTAVVPEDARPSDRPRWGTPEEVAPLVRELDASGDVRFVAWAYGGEARWLLREGIRPTRLWDVSEAHRLLHGGWRAEPPRAWALAAGLDPASAPAPPTGDLFDFTGPAEALDPDRLVRDDGHLRADAEGSWLAEPAHLVHWAQAALTCARRQEEQLAVRGPRAVAAAVSESAAAILAAELEHDGLPIDREVAERLIAASAGRRPASEAEAREIRRERDAVVLRHLPAGTTADLRQPGSVRAMLASVGIRVESTRKWEIDAYRDAHPVVPALLAWRADERIATTYGYRWLDEHVGPDDRLRGGWTVCDGAAGRMTAQNGLHNLPVSLRPAVAARADHVLVRADLGQIEPRVLAAVSGDSAFAAATRADDLYAPVAARLGVDRAVAKVAVLAAMYGQRSGAAGEALKGLERAYPVAMAHLDRAYAAGARGEPVHTWGGRLVRTDHSIEEHPVGSNPAVDAGRGRFARNAVIQGSAAELFKAWAATVRATTRDLGAEIVLCLHDELLVHAPEEAAQAVVARLRGALDASARRWTGSDSVRFVADVSVVRRWSEAKG